MVRAIERNESILQTNLAERIQQTQQQHPDLQQRYFQIQLNQERHKMLNKANAPDEPFQTVIGEEERQQQQGNPQRGKNRQRIGEQEIPEDGDNDTQSHIDVEV